MHKQLRYSRLLIGAVAALTLASAQGQSNYDWTGFYAGGNLGALAFETDTADHWCFLACDAPGGSDIEVTAGIQGGYNWQVGENFVVGFEADLGTGAESSETIRFSDDDGAIWKSEWNWLATLRGRAGLNVNRTMIYVTGGLAVADGDFSVTEFGPSEGDDLSASTSETMAGLVGGVGIEHAVNDQLRVKVEVLSITMPKEDACWRELNDEDGACVAGEGANDDYVHWRTSGTSVRLGLNWAF